MLIILSVYSDNSKHKNGKVVRKLEIFWQSIGFQCIKRNQILGN